MYFLGENNFKFVEVLSFTRLLESVFRKVGNLFKNKLTDSSRNLIMSIAIDNLKSNLMVYSKSDDIDNINTMVDILKEFKSCKISFKNIENICEKLENDIFKQKILETKLILECYEKLVSEKFSDPLENLNSLTELINKYKLFKNYIIFVDSFHGFTLQQLNILEIFLIQSKDMYITFCSDANYLNSETTNLFSSVYKNINNLIKLSKKNNIKINEILLNNSIRFKNSELVFLEKNFFSNIKFKYIKNLNNIEIYRAFDIYDECDFIAREIKKLVFKKNHRYKDFTVITRNIEEYKFILKNTFENYNINFFIDSPKKLTNNNLLKLVFFVLSIIRFNFDSSYILKYLKTGLVNLSIEEVSNLENYILLWDINGNDWLKDFYQNPNGFSEKFENSDKEFLENLNILREKIIKPLENLKKNITNQTNDKICFYLYKFLEEINIQKNIQNFCEDLLNKNYNLSAEEISKTWNILINSLDEMSSILKDKKISLKKFSNLLSIVINSNDISFVPQNLDEVKVCSIERSKISNPKISFVIGLIDKKFPKVFDQAGVFNDSERKKLIKLGLNMNDTLEEKDVFERFLAYLAVTSCSEKLYLTYHNLNVSGSENLNSELIKEIKKIFININTVDYYSQNLEDLVWAESPSFEFLSKNFNNNSEFFYNLKYYFNNNLNYKNKLETLNEVSKERNLEFKDKNNAKKLIGNKMHISASQIEKFYICKFQFFCKYLLNIKERKTDKFNKLEYGNFMHFLLEKIYKNNILKLDNEKIRKEIVNIADEYIDKNLGGFDNKSERFKHQILKCLDIIEIIIKYLKEEMSQSKFKSIGQELKICNSGDIEPLEINEIENFIIEISGKIDRADIMELKDKKYVRIIDYKTSKKDFKLSGVLYGLNLQMFLYLMAILEDNKYKNMEPAGILYMSIIRPSIENEKIKDKSKLELKIKKCLKMDGIILNNLEIIRGMESLVQNIFIPISSKMDNESLISKENIDYIFEKVKEKIIHMISELRDGKINSSPVILNDKNFENKIKSCDFCSYKSICGCEKKDLIEVKNINKFEIFPTKKQINTITNVSKFLI
ncbi:MAG: PD-(D/E)XK nuclease family protein [Candidatus Paraimprobicoccus trichonymphae]|uniref:PD-(D/E)XK nuclease family protein n=1 Tax=Candidatus Paraimprobicoccus trichonymphae TaxID=3033793 RepID=A0AA48I3N0_9FIRM|nr:MAG: PD-(D/E)XK nuclease family protein [Candidatus Paraimprobicoccus trichonymphae]